MVRYADKECADCHAVMPANQMHKVHQDYESGRTLLPSDSDLKIKNFSSHRPEVTHFKSRTIFRCSACVERRKAARFKKLVIFSGVGAGLILMWLVLMATMKMSPLSSSQSPPPTSRDSIEPSVTQADSSPKMVPTPSNATDATPDENVGENLPAATDLPPDFSLAGRWAPNEDLCLQGRAMTLREDHTFSTRKISGLWTRDGKDIQLAVTQQIDSDGNQTDSPPVVWRGTVSYDDERISVTTEGGRGTMSRCKN